MTNEQVQQLLELLERIALTLETMAPPKKVMNPRHVFMREELQRQAKIAIENELKK